MCPFVSYSIHTRIFRLDFLGGLNCRGKCVDFVMVFLFFFFNLVVNGFVKQKSF